MNKYPFISMVILGVVSMLHVIDSSHVQDATNGVNTFHSNKDSSPIETVIMINEDQNNNVSYQPNVVTIRVGGEILIANNATSDHSVTSGSGPDDPM
jgi:plastocyanin